MTTNTKKPSDTVSVDGWGYEIYYGFITQEQADELNDLDDESESEELASELCTRYLVHGFVPAKIEATDPDGNESMIDDKDESTLPAINDRSIGIPKEQGKITLVYVVENMGNWYIGSATGITVTHTTVYLDNDAIEICTIKNADGTDVDYEVEQKSFELYFF